MGKYKIKQIEAGEILDSRGEPTVMTTVTLSNGVKSTAAVPSGTSTGKFEAHELRDGFEDRYGGRGVLKACSNVNVKIEDVLMDMDAEDQEAVDKVMINLDGTENKSKLGANAILSVSLAVARAVSVARDIPLYESLQESFGFDKTKKMPIPAMNLINGGKHADTNIVLQEFQIIPIGIESMEKQVEAGSEIFHALAKVLDKKGFDTDVGNEGGYAPDINDIEDMFDSLLESIKISKYEVGKDIVLGIDAAANSFYNESTDKYIVAPPEKNLSVGELSELYISWIDKYNLKSIEDPFLEDSWDDWSNFLKQVESKKIMIIGDDLLVTNKERLKKGIKEKSINTILIKPNQIGTLSETVETIKLATENNIKIEISHRSGETQDTFISDLAVAVGSEYIKAGAPSRGERVAKYNRLMEIERDSNK
jgi:enolase